MRFGPHHLHVRRYVAAAFTSVFVLGIACDGETDLDLKKERDFRPGTVESPREEAR